MEEKKINLEELFNNHFDCYTNFEDKGNYNDEPAISKDKFKELFLEFGKQLLELAAENAKTTEISIENWEEIDYESDFNYIPLMNEWGEIEGLNKIIINKQSILDTIKQVE